MVTSPALIMSLAFNKFPNKLAPKVSLFLIVMPFMKKTDSLMDLFIFTISFIFLLEINSVVLSEVTSEGQPDQNIFLWIAITVADSVAVISNGIKMPKRLPKNYPDCPVLCNWIFDNFILAEELLPKSLRNLKTCVLVNNNLRGKLFHH